MLRALAIRPFALAFDDMAGAFGRDDRQHAVARYRRSPASRAARARARHTLGLTRTTGL